ncbi:hypothetical protein HJC23_013653 [Cyclotella cryptica]|uniref:Uncharacterized protein n=1 Tax=Cyclotella cryptica TaxID=29204 RepID=A0ABD3QW12_9STRA
MPPLNERVSEPSHESSKCGRPMPQNAPILDNVECSVFSLPLDGNIFDAMPMSLNGSTTTDSCWLSRRSHAYSRPPPKDIIMPFWAYGILNGNWDPSMYSVGPLVRTYCSTHQPRRLNDGIGIWHGPSIPIRIGMGGLRRHFMRWRGVRRY